jgi:MFS family permease
MTDPHPTTGTARTITVPVAFRAYDSATAALALFLVTAAVNVEMPLYRVYAAQSGYGNGMTTLVFAAYIAGLLPTLIFFGGISDRIGRKAALFAGLSAALCATVLMIYRPGLHPLFISRIFQGMGVGLSMGAGSAYLAESLGGGKAAQRSAGYVAIATSLGFGGGALFTGTVLLFNPSPSPISYRIIAFGAAVCLAMILGIRGNPGTGGSLLRLPYFPKGTLPVALTITLAWAVTGVVISLMPAQLARNGLSAWAGHALFLVNATGVAVQPWARKMDPRKALLMGAIVLPIGYFVLLYGAWAGHMALVLSGAAMAGSACYGFTYLGGLAELSHRGAEQRARAVSGYFVFAYLGFGLPSVALGFLADRFGLIPTLTGFGALLFSLCVWQAVWSRSRANEVSA